MPDPDINQQILEEIRKLRRSNQWGMIFAISLLVVVCVYAFRNLPSRHASPWTEVSTAMRQSDYPKALRLAQEQATAHPDDYYGHEYLGNIYLAMGEPSHAEGEYERAYELLPSEDIKAKLETIRKRLENDAAKPH